MAVDRTRFLVVNNCIIQWSQVLYIIQDSDRPGIVRLYFTGRDEPLVFEGAEASEVWRAFDDAPGWRGENRS